MSPTISGMLVHLGRELPVAEAGGHHAPQLLHLEIAHHKLSVAPADRTFVPAEVSVFLTLVDHCLTPISAALMVFIMSMQMVMGPTPPGTGVIAEAFSLTCSKSTSPTTL